MRNLLRGLDLLLPALQALLRALPDFLAIARRYLAGLGRWCRRPPAKERGGCCVELPVSELRRADPLVYSQEFLSKNGLAVTWDNPDIQLYRQGAPVSSSELQPDTEYEVVIRVWNNAYQAPALGLPVVLSYLSFGIGTTSHAVGETAVDLGAKATSTCPAYARIPWRTPAEPGHYCLQARLLWSDDANPDNNMGQENTQVGALHSPATFHFRARNDAGVRRRFRFDADMYRLGPRPACAEANSKEERRPASRLEESRARWAEARREHGESVAPVTADWRVGIEPAEITLAPEEEIDVTVTIEPTAGSFAGRERFNVNGYAQAPDGEWRLVGGVTLDVVGNG